MPQYLVSNYIPDDFDPATVTEAMMEEIHALNRELIAAGARKFACGIAPAAKAKAVRKQPDGRVLVTDGPYTETKEHMGGFWILEAADLDEALAWAKKAAITAMCPAKCANFFSTRTRRGQRNSLIQFCSLSHTDEKIWKPCERRPHEKDQDSRTHLAGRNNPGARWADRRSPISVRRMGGAA